MGKKRVAILFGGRSVEHKVSLRSAKNIFDNIDRSLFEVVLIGISQRGDWYYLNKYDHSIEKGELLSLNLSLQSNPFFCTGTNYDLGPIDVVFPVLHGNDGEDGSIQGLLRTRDIPFVGSGVLGSSVSFDKVCSKRLLDEAGIPNAKYLTIPIEAREQFSFAKVKESLGLPLFIKPVASGSSVGVYKVKDEFSYTKAINDAFQYDNMLLLEEFIDGREIECAVKGNINPATSLPGEIVVTGGHDFYSFDAKYVDESGSRLDMPAQVSEAIVKRVQELAVKAYKALYCEDFSRVDMFLTKDNRLLVNEINTIPGFTNISMFPSLWRISGMNYAELITDLIDLALEKHKRISRIRRDFESAL